MTIAAVTLFLTVIGAFVVQACAPRSAAQGRLAARDRWTLLAGFVTAVTAFAMVSLPLEEVSVPTSVWRVGVGLLAGGVGGAVLRWPNLAWYAGTTPRRRAIRVSATLGICGLLIGIAVI